MVEEEELGIAFCTRAKMRRREVPWCKSSMWGLTSICGMELRLKQHVPPNPGAKSRDFHIHAMDLFEAATFLSAEHHLACCFAAMKIVLCKCGHRCRLLS